MIFHRLRSAEPYLPYLMIAGALLGLGIFLFALPNLLSLDDGLRHFVMARVMLEKGIANADWSLFLYRGALSTVRTDPWFLSDVLFIPLLPLGFTGALKVFSLIAAGVLLLSFDLLTRSFGLTARHRVFFLFLLLSLNGSFVFRLLLGRPFPLLTALTLLLLWAMLQRRWWIAGVIMAVSVLVSQLFVFPLFIGGVITLQRFFMRGWKPAVPCFMACFGGVIAGLLLHPAAIEYVRYIVTVFLMIPLRAGSENGSEMQSGMYGDGAVTFAALGIIVMMLTSLFHAKKLRWKNFLQSDLCVLVILTITFTAAFFPWRRATDVLWPVQLLLIARLIAEWPSLPRDLLKLLLPPLPRHLFTDVILCTGIVTLIGTGYVLALHNDRQSLSRYAAVRSLPAGARVLNVDWDVFPALLAVRPDLRYATGIDAVFTVLPDPEVAALFAQVSPVRTEEEMAALDADAWLTRLLALYDGEYLALERLKRKEFLEALSKHPQLTVASSDDAMVIFAIQRR